MLATQVRSNHMVMDKTDIKPTALVPKGVLLVIGGNENKAGSAESKVQEENGKPLEVLEKFVELIGKEKCTIEIITTASSEGNETFGDYQKVFSSLCKGHIGHIHHDARKEALGQDLMGRINKADGIFFSGGDQLKLTSIYGGTQLLLRLKQRYIFDDIVIGGTSAGAMALSTPMIFSGSKENQQLVGEVKITTGLEFLKDVCIDTHFVDRARFVRMAQVIATNPTCVGIGIEEDTAFIVRGSLNLEVIGSGVVLVLEGYGITESNILEYGTGKRISITDLNVKLLASGDTYRLNQFNPPHL